MAKAATIGRFVALGTVLAASVLCLNPARAKSSHPVIRVTSVSHAASSHRSAASYAAGHGASARVLVHRVSLDHHSKYAFLKGSKGRSGRHGYAYGGEQCVPFARAASGIELKGNAANWWDAAAGVYQRGSLPEQGSVLNFRANGHMRLGHVAVVTEVVDSRNIAIEHANWAGPGANKGGITRDIPVEDVSPDNDWSEVRVGLGRGGEYGSVYRTYGFIYDRPDNGEMLANRPDAGTTRTAQAVSLTELAQAPADAAPAPAATARLILDAPSRNLQ